MAWALAGCGSSPGTWSPPGAELPELELVASAVDCDVDASSWTITAEATSFTGGASTVWTADGIYVELHPVPVVRSAPDGTGDELEGLFPIVTDWRLATNAKTSLSCADAPTIAVVLLDPDGGVAGCAVHGDEPELLREAAPAACFR